MGDVT